MIPNDRDLEPLNFAIWTDMNLSSQVDFLQDIVDKHGDLFSEYSSLSEIVEALRIGQQYALKFRQHLKGITKGKEIVSGDKKSKYHAIGTIFK